MKKNVVFDINNVKLISKKKKNSKVISKNLNYLIFSNLVTHVSLSCKL